MNGLVLGGLGLMGLLLILGTKDSVAKLIEGHRYRFTAEVKPPLKGLAVDAMTKALRDTGAEVLTIHNGEESSVITYEATAMENKDLNLNQPVFAIGDTKAVITNVREV